MFKLGSLNGPRHTTNVANAWMRLLSNRVGDKMPDTLAINLPDCLAYPTIYGYLRDELTVFGEDGICYSQFYRLINDEFSDVFIAGFQCHATQNRSK